MVLLWWSVRIVIFKVHCSLANLSNTYFFSSWRYSEIWRQKYTEISYNALQQLTIQSTTIPKLNMSPLSTNSIWKYQSNTLNQITSCKQISHKKHTPNLKPSNPIKKSYYHQDLHLTRVYALSRVLEHVSHKPTLAYLNRKKRHHQHTKQQN